LLSPQIVYNANDVILEWDQLSFLNYLTISNDIKLTQNQTSVARALDSIANSKATNDVQLVNYLDYLSNLTNQLPIAFNEISPDQLSSMMMGAFAVMDAQGDEFLKRATELHTDYEAMYDAQLRHRAVSTNAFDHFVDKTWDLYWDLPVNVVNVQGDENAEGYGLTTAGVTIGGDGKLNDHTYLGGSLGYLSTGAGLEDGGSMTLNTFDANLYGTWFDGGLYLEGLLGVDLNSYKTKRDAIEGTADGSAGGFAWTGLLGGGYDFKNGPWAIGPQVDIQYLSAGVSPFTENGSISSLHIFSQDETDFHTLASVDVHYHWLAGTWTYVTPEFSLGWRHDVMPDSLPVSAQFAGGQGSAFTVYGPKIGSDSAVSTLGLSIQWRPSFNTFLNLTFQLGRTGYSAENVNLGMRFYF
jgi:outer membrane autotransporter protein